MTEKAVAVSSTSVVTSLSHALLVTVGLACILVLPLMGNPFGAHGYGYAKTGWLLICSSVLITLTALIGADGGLVAARAAAKKGGLVLALLAAWMLWIAISASVSIEPLVAWLGDSPRREGGLSWLACAAICVTAFLTGSKPEGWRAWTQALSWCSLLPAVATIGQFLHTDFSFTITLTGTSGNPVFLGAILMAVLPLSIAQVLSAQTGKFERYAWGLLGLAQAVALALTFARGPILGALLGVWLFLAASSLAVRNANLVRAAVAVPVAALVFLLMVNMIPSLPDQFPAFQRFLFKATASNEARIGYWGAGLALWADLPFGRQLAGVGPDTGLLAYMTHVPAWLYRLEGFGLRMDRLHNEILESLLQTGAVGALLEMAFFNAVVLRALHGLGLRMPYVRLALFGLIGGALAAAIGALLMANFTVVPVAFGIGIGAGWIVAWLLAQWRAGGSAGQHFSQHDGLRLAALGAGVIGFWIESQLGVNDITVRAIVFAMAGMIAAKAPFCHASALGVANQPQDSSVDRRSYLSPWLACCAIPVYFLLWTTPHYGGSVWIAPSIMQYLECALGLTLFSGFGWLCARERREALPSGGSRGGVSFGSVGLFAAAVLGYAVIHFIVMSTLVGEGVGWTMALDGPIAIFWAIAGFSLIVAGLLALAVFARTHQNPLADFMSRPGPTIATALLGLVMTGSVTWYAINESRADAATRLAQWAASQGKWERQLHYAEAATQIAPFERLHWATLAQAYFQQGLLAAQAQNIGPPERSRMAVDAITRSMQAAVRAEKLAPRDPFILGLIAENHMFWTSPASAGLAQSDAERRQHAQAAITNFERSILTRHSYPTVLRNLAQLEAGYGDPTRGFGYVQRLLNEDPKSDIGYLEKAQFALRQNDIAGALSTLRNGIEATGGLNSIRRPLAELLFRQGDVPGATLEMEAVVKQAPKDWFATRDLIRLYLRQNANDKALALAQSARQFVPEQERASLEDLLRKLEPQPFTGGGLKP